MLNSKNERARDAAVSSLLALAPVELILKAWRGEGLRKQVKEGIRIRIAKLLFLHDELCIQSQILETAKDAATNDSSPEVRQYAGRVVEHVAYLDRKKIEDLEPLTPEQQSRMHLITQQIVERLKGGSTSPTCLNLAETISKTED